MAWKVLKELGGGGVEGERERVNERTDLDDR